MTQKTSQCPPARPSTHGFVLTTCKPSETLQGEMRIYTHERTGAVLMHMACADPHKAFGIGFKTPPFNSSGVAHILEHSVLCGSQKYPVKEPFANLLRSSLQTFLNAMTFPDRTIYPFSSQNEKDYLNILDVYLDAVLHPRIYEEPMIFEKEGHHFELVDDQLSISGVVYNEMKGSMSSRYSILGEAVNRELYDNEYGFNAGGAPEAIETLTYEQFCQFHRDHYHPSNSFSFVYGDIDIDLVTAKMDASFEGFERRDCDYVIKDATPFTKPQSIRVPFSAAGDDDTSILSYNYLLPEQLCAKDNLALGVILSAFADASSSKLQLRLLNSGLCTKCSASFDFISKQPSITIMMSGIDVHKVDEVSRVVNEEIEYTAQHGLDLKLVEAYLNQQIFSMRSGDFEGLYKGLYLGLVMSNPLMFDQDPLPHLDYIQTSHLVLEELASAKAGSSTYFDDLFRTLIVQNNHVVICELYPQPNLITAYNEKKAAELASLYEQMTEEEREQVRRHTAEIAEYASTPDTPEAEATIPQLERSDISMHTEDFSVETTSHGLYKPVAADGIEYLTLFTPLHAPSTASDAGAVTINREELPLLHLLTKMYGMLNTGQRSFEELDTALNTSLGRFSVSPLVVRDYQKTCADPTSEDRYHFYLTCSAAYLEEHTQEARSLIQEIIEDTQFDDHERIARLLGTMVVDMQNAIPDDGNVLAISRLKSYYSPQGALVDAMSGVEGLEQLKRLTSLESVELATRLKTLHDRIRTSRERFVYLANTTPTPDQVSRVAHQFGCIAPPSASAPECLPIEARGALNEALAIQSEVQYVAQGGTLPTYLAYSGTAAVAAQIVKLNHLWTKIRVEGGAYGCIPSPLTADMSIVSYRDPRIDRTYQTYQNIPEFLANLNLTEREFTNFIISTIAKTSIPLRPAQLADQSIMVHLSGTPQEVFTTCKEEIVACTLEQVRDCAQYYEHMLNQGYICTAGSRDKLEAAQTAFSALVEVN